MSGHSRWANIKHRKARTDAKRGKAFTKIVKELTVAARLGGSDVSMNPRLRAAVENARDENMPSDTIERAIKKGAGELEGVTYEEGVYEGYGPGGVAVIVSYMTDNRNRTASDVRHSFSKYGGSLGSSGSVLWMFEKKGFFTFRMGVVSEERLLEEALEAGAEDVRTNAEDGSYEVYTDPHDFHKIKSAFDSKGLKYETAEVSMIPKTLVRVSGKTAEQVLHLLDTLEDLDDVQNVYANFDIPSEEIELVEMA